MGISDDDTDNAFQSIDYFRTNTFEHLPLHIIGPMRYGGKFAHKCMPESSGREQM